MSKIYFATTNKDKLREARMILGIEVEGVERDIEEIQSLDSVKVAEQKARDYFDAVGKPMFIEDLSLVVNAWNGLPGPYIDSFMKGPGNDGILQLLKGFEDRSAIAQTTIVYVDKSGECHTFIGEVKGVISEMPKGDKGFGWDAIFIPEGDKRTFGEMELADKNKYSMRAIALKKLKKWLETVS